jgi:ABC-type sugar transport system ATPase subunit
LARSVSRSSEIEHADTRIRASNIRPADAGDEAGKLSGGNQEKVVLAKWLSTDANVFFSTNRLRASTSALKTKSMTSFEILPRAAKLS